MNRREKSEKEERRERESRTYTHARTHARTHSQQEKNHHASPVFPENALENWQKMVWAFLSAVGKLMTVFHRRNVPFSSHVVWQIPSESSHPPPKKETFRRCVHSVAGSRIHTSSIFWELGTSFSESCLESRLCFFLGVMVFCSKCARGTAKPMLR